MNEKEKAEELVEKYRQLAYYNSSNPNPKLMVDQLESNAKQCAIIAVNEVINDCDASNPFEIERLSYWLNVKTEINNL